MAAKSDPRPSQGSRCPRRGVQAAHGRGRPAHQEQPVADQQLLPGAGPTRREQHAPVANRTSATTTATAKRARSTHPVAPVSGGGAPFSLDIAPISPSERPSGATSGRPERMIIMRYCRSGVTVARVGPPISLERTPPWPRPGTAPQTHRSSRATSTLPVPPDGGARRGGAPLPPRVAARQQLGLRGQGGPEQRAQAVHRRHRRGRRTGLGGLRPGAGAGRPLERRACLHLRAGLVAPSRLLRRAHPPGPPVHPDAVARRTPRGHRASATPRWSAPRPGSWPTSTPSASSAP